MEVDALMMEGFALKKVRQVVVLDRSDMKSPWLLESSTQAVVRPEPCALNCALKGVQLHGEDDAIEPSIFPTHQQVVGLLQGLQVLPQGCWVQAQSICRPQEFRQLLQKDQLRQHVEIEQQDRQPTRWTKVVATNDQVEDVFANAGQWRHTSLVGSMRSCLSPHHEAIRECGCPGILVVEIQHGRTLT